MKPSTHKDIARVIFQKYEIRPSSESVNILTDILELHNIKYRTLIQQPGDLVSRFYYIERGLVRVFHTDPTNNTDIVDDFFKEKDMLITADLFTENAAKLSVNTIEPTFAFAFSYASLQRLALENRDFNNLLCAILGEYILHKEEYINLLSLPLQDRYKTMSRKYGTIIWRSPSKSIASYLKMRSETLSRIRTSLNNEDSNS